MSRRTLLFQRATLLACSTFLACAAVAARQEALPALTLERIMADPDWIGSEPEDPYWADDGRSLYYRRKRPGEEERDLVQIDLAGRELRVVAPAERLDLDVPGGDTSADFARKVYAREGDLYLRDLATGAVTQLTRTAAAESQPAFLDGDTRIQYRRDGKLLVRELANGLELEPAEFLAEVDPAVEKEQEADFLAEQQQRLFEVLREEKAEREARRERERAERQADPGRAPLPFYLGDKLEVLRTSLAPSGKHALVVVAPKGNQRGKRDSMPAYVTESGYVETRTVRDKVGTAKPRTESLLLFDLATREKHELALDALPGVVSAPSEPGAEGDAGDAEDAADAGKAQKPRPVHVGTWQWNERGDRALVECTSLDNKDRWIALVDVATHALVPLERQTDEAWIGGRAQGGLGWLRDGRSFYFLSEETGYAHLYLRDVEAGTRRALTSGEFEVTRPVLERSETYLYYTANAAHPGVHDTWRIALDTGRPEQLTDLGGQTWFALSPDGERLLLEVSRVTEPPELWLQEARPGGEARRLTLSTSEEFRSIPWLAPEIVAIPGRHGRPIWSRVYATDAPNGGRPAVVFVHGAGYLQNAHAGWSSYFREFMFHNLLAARGFVVLDMDYRASAGYGRDWRTAIYRQMGTPELEDLRDGVEWLVANRGVDRERVGVYGGSYGGFLTLMALFREPDLFACGAALRPVTDWAHYAHGYTANILNTPAVDAEAYAASSPIEFAAGLERPLLICHGMQDDNVLFQDTVRLTQRLIELGKENWEVALYPVEPHSFREPASWLDEYRRILKLFETHLAGGSG